MRKYPASWAMRCLSMRQRTCRANGWLIKRPASLILTKISLDDAAPAVVPVLPFVAARVILLRQKCFPLRVHPVLVDTSAASCPARFVLFCSTYSTCGRLTGHFVFRSRIFLQRGTREGEPIGVSYSSRHSIHHGLVRIVQLSRTRWYSGWMGA